MVEFHSVEFWDFSTPVTEWYMLYPVCSLFIPFAQVRSVFCSVHAYNWLDETHSHHGRQSAYTNFTDLNVNLIQRYCCRNIQDNVDHISVHHDPGKLTHRINPPIWFCMNKIGKSNGYMMWVTTVAFFKSLMLVLISAVLPKIHSCIGFFLATTMSLNPQVWEPIWKLFYLPVISFLYRHLRNIYIFKGNSCQINEHIRNTVQWIWNKFISWSP